MAAKKSCLPEKHAAMLKRYFGPSEGEVIDKISHGVVAPSRLRALGLCDGEIDQLANAVASAAVSTNALFRLRFGERNVRTPRHAIRERDHSSDPAARRPFIKPEKISKRSSRRGSALPIGAVCDSLSRASKENLPAAANDGERSRRAVRRLKWPNDQISQLNNGAAQSATRTPMQSGQTSEKHARERTIPHGGQRRALQGDVPRQSGNAETAGSVVGSHCDGGAVVATPCSNNGVRGGAETQALAEAILQPFHLHLAQTIGFDGVGDPHDESSVHAQLDVERRRRVLAQHALRECHRQLENLQLRLSGMQMGVAEMDEAMDCPPYTPYVEASSPFESPFASPFASAHGGGEPPYTPFQLEAPHNSPAGVICL